MDFLRRKTNEAFNDSCKLFRLSFDRVIKENKKVSASEIVGMVGTLTILRRDVDPFKLPLRMRKYLRVVGSFNIQLRYFPYLKTTIEIIDSQLKKIQFYLEDKSSAFEDVFRG